VIANLLLEMAADFDSENEALLEATTDHKESQAAHQKTGYRWKEIALFLVVLCMQCGTTISESFMLPFFPIEADKRHLTQTHTGIVFSAYEVARFLTSPIAGSLVSNGRFLISPIAGSLISNAMLNF